MNGLGSNNNYIVLWGFFSYFNSNIHYCWPPKVSLQRTRRIVYSHAFEIKFRQDLSDAVVFKLYFASESTEGLAKTLIARPQYGI